MLKEKIFEKFCEEVVLGLGDGFEKVEVYKDNDKKHVGIKNSSSKVSPVIYLNDYFDDFMKLIDGRTEPISDLELMKEIDSVCLDVLRDFRCAEEASDLGLCSTDNILAALRADNITFELVDKSLNTKTLKDVVCKDVGAGLVLVPYCQASDKCAFKVTKELLKVKGYTDSFIDMAFDKFVMKYPPMFGDILSFLLTNENKNPYYEVATGNTNILNIKGYRYGAVALAYPGLLDIIRDSIGDFYIVPVGLEGVHIISKDALPKETLEKALTGTNNGFETGTLSDRIFEYDGELK